jgi:arylsulfatase A-like enzyme
VPLILRLPGRLPAGRRVAARVELVDLMPTVLALLGVTPPPALQGQSLVPLLEGKGHGPAVVVAEHSTAAIGRTYESVRLDHLAYIVDGAVEQLFDLEGDPGEHVNLAATRAPALIAMRDELARWREACRPLAARFGPRGGAVAPDAETARQLRALGYVGGD